MPQDKKGNPRVSDDEIIETLRIANAEFVLQMEHGLDTNVGNLGSQLSGGQKQRLAIARALIKRPKILIFDEATSALDHKNEQEVQKAIQNIKYVQNSFHGFNIKKTTDLEDEEMNERNNPVTQIIIAHRMTTIQHCDKILVVDQGQVIEQGNHETLLEKFPFGLYAQMLQKQIYEDERAAKSEPPVLESMQKILEEEEQKTPVHVHQRNIEGLELSHRQQLLEAPAALPEPNILTTIPHLQEQRSVA